MPYIQLKKVLLLEDTGEDILFIRRVIAKAGLPVHFIECREYKSFIENLNNFTPDIILSDYHVPPFNGVEALAISKEMYPDVPFIFVTGKISADLADETILVSADAYVLKDELTYLPSVIKLMLKQRAHNYNNFEHSVNYL
ncbi:MAG: response regulator [Bacteroidota bacterium]